MTHIFQKITDYFYVFAKWLGQVLDDLSEKLISFKNSEETGEYIGRAEEWIRSVLPEDKRWFGVISLAAGLIILFAVLADSVISWIILVALLTGGGILLTRFEDR